MEKMPIVFKAAWPYQQDVMNLPVLNLEAALPFYETVMGFQLRSRSENPAKSAVLSRDGIQIGLAENGGDPTQDGCFFEVNDVESAFTELQDGGLTKERGSAFSMETHGNTNWKVFYVVAPDGLCYCLGERQE